MRNGKKSLKKASVLLTTFLLVVMCLAVDTTSVSAAKIKLNKTKLTLTQGKKYRLKIKGTKKKVKWSSTKKSVATVNKKGVVTAKKKGTAYIKAKVGKKTYKCKVTVKSTYNTFCSGKSASRAHSNTYRSSSKNTSTKCNIFKYA